MDRAGHDVVCTKDLVLSRLSSFKSTFNLVNSSLNFYIRFRSNKDFVLIDFFLFKRKKKIKFKRKLVNTKCNELLANLGHLLTVT